MVEVSGMLGLLLSAKENLSLAIVRYFTVLYCSSHFVMVPVIINYQTD